MSCVPCDAKFIAAMSTVIYRNSFQFPRMARPNSPQLSCRVFFHTSDSFTRMRTKIASSAGSPPRKNKGRQPTRGKTKK